MRHFLLIAAAMLFASLAAAQDTTRAGDYFFVVDGTEITVWAPSDILDHYDIPMWRGNDSVALIAFLREEQLKAYSRMGTAMAQSEQSEKAARQLNRLGDAVDTLGYNNLAEQILGARLVSRYLLRYNNERTILNFDAYLKADYIGNRKAKLVVKSLSYAILRNVAAEPVELFSLNGTSWRGRDADGKLVRLDKR